MFWESNSRLAMLSKLICHIMREVQTHLRESLKYDRRRHVSEPRGQADSSHQDNGAKSEEGDRLERGGQRFHVAVAYRSPPQSRLLQVGRRHAVRRFPSERWTSEAQETLEMGGRPSEDDRIVCNHFTQAL